MMIINAAGLDRTEVRRMLLIGIPTFIALLGVAQGMGSLAYIAFFFIAMVPYSYFYSIAYREFAVATKPGRKARFYVAAIAIQLVVIAGAFGLHAVLA